MHRTFNEESEQVVNTIGKKLRKLRNVKGFSLEFVASQTDSSKSYIWELENKKELPKPSAEKLTKIAKLLDTTVDYLMDDGDELPQENATDARFYRDYQMMDESTKEKIREMVKLWSSKK